MTDKIDAAVIRELLAKITQGEWKVYDDKKFTEIAVEGGERLLMVARAYRAGRANGTSYRMPDQNNAALIAAAPAIARYALELSDKVEKLTTEKNELAVCAHLAAVDRDALRARWTAALQLIRAKADEWEKRSDYGTLGGYMNRSAAARTLLQELEQLESGK